MPNIAVNLQSIIRKTHLGDSLPFANTYAVEMARKPLRYVNIPYARLSSLSTCCKTISGKQNEIETAHVKTPRHR